MRCRDFGASAGAQPRMVYMAPNARRTSAIPGESWGVLLLYDYDWKARAESSDDNGVRRARRSSIHSACKGERHELRSWMKSIKKRCRSVHKDAIQKARWRQRNCCRGAIICVPRKTIPRCTAGICGLPVHRPAHETAADSLLGTT